MRASLSLGSGLQLQLAAAPQLYWFIDSPDLHSLSSPSFSPQLTSLRKRRFSDHMEPAARSTTVPSVPSSVEEGSDKTFVIENRPLERAEETGEVIECIRPDYGFSNEVFATEDP